MSDDKRQAPDFGGLIEEFHEKVTDGEVFCISPERSDHSIGRATTPEEMGRDPREGACIRGNHRVELG